MKVSIDHKGKVKGMDRVLSKALEEYSALSYEETGELCKDFGSLIKEIAELAWVARMSARRGVKYFGYEIEIFATATGLKWQRYRTEAVPPPPCWLS